MQTESIINNVRDLLPTIRARRQEIEESRRMPRDLADALRKTGIFSLAIPRALGGQEANPVDIMKAIETAATSDSPTGWRAMIGTRNNVSAGYINDRARRKGGAILRPLQPESRRRPARLFAWTAACASTVAGPSPAALRMRTGCGRAVSSWTMASRGDTTRTRDYHVCMPTSDVDITTRVRERSVRTGSNDFSAADVFVPSTRIFALLDPVATGRASIRCRRSRSSSSSSYASANWHRTSRARRADRAGQKQRCPSLTRRCSPTGRVTSRTGARRGRARAERARSCTTRPKTCGTPSRRASRCPVVSWRSRASPRITPQKPVRAWQGRPTRSPAAARFIRSRRCNATRATPKRLRIISRWRRTHGKKRDACSWDARPRCRRFDVSRPRRNEIFPRR